MVWAGPINGHILTFASIKVAQSTATPLLFPYLDDLSDGEIQKRCRGYKAGNVFAFQWPSHPEVAASLRR